jgi:hypothetical protein
MSVQEVMDRAIAKMNCHPDTREWCKLIDSLNLNGELDQLRSRPQGMHPLEYELNCEILWAKIDRLDGYKKPLQRRQRRLGISGLRWWDIDFLGWEVRTYQLVHCLSATKRDEAIVRQNEASVIEFMANIRPYFKVWVENASAAEDEYPWIELPGDWDPATDPRLKEAIWVSGYKVDSICNVQEVEEVGVLPTQVGDETINLVMYEPTGESYEKPVFYFGFTAHCHRLNQWDCSLPSVSFQFNNSEPSM